MSAGESRSVAIVGAGTIGLSWATRFAFYGWDVRVFDTSESRRESAPREMAPMIAELETVTGARAGERVSLLQVSPSLAEATSGASLVLENLPERLDLKRAFYAELADLVPSNAVVASSTSALLPSALFGGLAIAERALVAHPLNPPHLLPVVELVTHPTLSSTALEAAREVFASLEMTAVVCEKEEPGFLANRLQYALFGEALRLLQDGVASLHDIDAVIRDGLGPRWALLGPFGVEASNAESIEDNYGKYGNTIRELVQAVASTQPALDDQSLAAVVPLTVDAMALSGAPLIAYRRAALVGIQAQKRRAPQPYREGTTAPTGRDMERRSERIADPKEDMTLAVTQKHYVPDSAAHYGGGVISGGYIMTCFSDVATEVCIRHDGTEGLFASYSGVQFGAALFAGDLVEVSARITRVGTRSRDLAFEVRVLARRENRDSDRSTLLEEPIVAATANGTVVIPVREEA